MHQLLEHINQAIKRRYSKDNYIKLKKGAKEIQQVNPGGPDNSQKHVADSAYFVKSTPPRVLSVSF